MIPILYEAGTTEYKTNGLGRLKDAISCNVIEERNGTYELSMTYPITGIHYADIAIDRIIYATPADGKSGQPFRIYKISRPMSGQVEISAEHISYLLSKAIVMPFTATSAVDAFNKLSQNIVGADGFTFSTDKAVTANFMLDQPMDCRSLLGGTSGSILDTYGTGEYEFDGFAVTLHLHRGVDNGVTIRYGKNLTDATRTSDMSNVYTGIVPYATVDDVTYTLSEKVVKSEHTGDFANPHYKVVDFSNRFGTDETPTEDKLRSYAETYVKNNEGWEISDNVSIEFAALWQTDEYKNMAIQRINLCDTIHVVYTDLGINVTAEVIKTDYDVLAERYNSIEVGNSSTNLSKTITDAIDDATGDIKAEVSALPSAIKKATEQITGGLGGYIVLKRNANGQPEELLIMDTDDVNTAVNVWRWNKGGLGHSHNGYDGPFDDVAITQDGAIVADYITTGTLNADLIKTGVIQDEAGSFYLDMKNGTLKLKNATFASEGDQRSVEMKEGQYFVYYTEDGDTHEVGRLGASFVKSAGTKGLALNVDEHCDWLAFGVKDDETVTFSTKLQYTLADAVWRCYTNFRNDKEFACYYNGTKYGGLSALYQTLALNIYKDATKTLAVYKWDGTSGSRMLVYDVDTDYWTVFGTWFANYIEGSTIKSPYVYGKTVETNYLINNSDRRLKDNIEALDEDKASAFVLALKPSKYVYKSTPNEIRHGFIAQDVQDIEYGGWSLVMETPNKDEEGNKYLGIGYLDLIADMVATIQSQHKRITDLEERLSKLEEALNADN